MAHVEENKEMSQSNSAEIKHQSAEIEIVIPLCFYRRPLSVVPEAVFICVVPSTFVWTTPKVNLALHRTLNPSLNHVLHPSQGCSQRASSSFNTMHKNNHSYRHAISLPSISPKLCRPSSRRILWCFQRKVHLYIPIAISLFDEICSIGWILMIGMRNSFTVQTTNSKFNVDWIMSLPTISSLQSKSVKLPCELVVVVLSL